MDNEAPGNDCLMEPAPTLSNDPFAGVLEAACTTVALSRSVSRLVPPDGWNDERQAIAVNFVEMLKSGKVAEALVMLDVSTDIDSLFPSPGGGFPDDLQWILGDLRRTSAGMVRGIARASLGKIIDRMPCPEPEFANTHERLFLECGFGHMYPVDDDYDGPARYFVDAPITSENLPPLPVSWRSWQMVCTIQAAMRTRIVLGKLSEEECDIGKDNHVSRDDAWRVFKQAHDRAIGRDLLGPPLATHVVDPVISGALDDEYAALVSLEEAESLADLGYSADGIDLAALLDESDGGRDADESTSIDDDNFDPLT